ncbi:DnaJ-class molecular chaperone [Caldalkalibacillus uzonensis]|uniref:DnaJ-class molecular chaperone n=1 Tax=Caldalkalibacillus uzonensis TaxID=353224 RepID=A0ABU0CXU3_9BACI|nr:DnaJ-class molecular chaperone [Caldalkalibacillus uzonensis]
MKLKFSQAGLPQATTHCEYCHGRGYFQLMLGGSETCVHCEGSGLAPAERLQAKPERKIDQIQLRWMSFPKYDGIL